MVNRLRELNREYEEKTGQGFVRFIETRMKTPESIAEKLQRKDYDVDFDTAVTAPVSYTHLGFAGYYNGTGGVLFRFLHSVQTDVTDSWRYRR